MGNFSKIYPRARAPHADEGDLAAALIAAVMRRIAPRRHARLLRELIRHGAAGLALLEGDRAASEACYRIADVAAARGESRLV